MAGKGDTPRPCDKKKYDENYDKIDWNDGSREGKPAWEKEPDPMVLVPVPPPPEGHPSLYDHAEKYNMHIDMADTEDRTGVVDVKMEDGKIRIEDLDLTAEEIMDVETDVFVKNLEENN